METPGTYSGMFDVRCIKRVGLIRFQARWRVAVDLLEEDGERHEGILTASEAREIAKDAALDKSIRFWLRRLARVVELKNAHDTSGQA